MASKSEVGFAKFNANLSNMIIIFTDMGPAYAPSNADSEIPNLKLWLTNTTDAQNDVNSKVGPYKVMVDAREATFDPVSKELTGLRKAFRATKGVGPAQMEDFDALARKYRGIKKVKTSSTDPDVNTHSNAKTSYDQRTNTIGEIVVLLNNTANYNPNEDKYKIAYWQTLQDTMLADTRNLNDASAPLASSRTYRKGLFYFNEVNASDTANAARTYGLSITPVGSPTYKALIKLNFRKPPK
ncbi:hypothetical protein M0G43_07125 [Subsaxibacter sp. CAU 1640]|uniref:hypothetical protein n=1 Tax=Subsaxibacter sp. CAU 1640 TaxID=2933271 RepID=UPI002004A444|nr:hypothetical protein [Subsaxibacter sp. CAU 1640]MCK7590339.1 hypothetical protein [Subsaxibacter sp. CAU 1640]